jgi:hypothetical protein
MIPTTTLQKIATTIPMMMSKPPSESPATHDMYHRAAQAKLESRPALRHEVTHNGRSLRQRR